MGKTLLDGRKAGSGRKTKEFLEKKSAVQIMLTNEVIAFFGGLDAVKSMAVSLIQERYESATFKP